MLGNMLTEIYGDSPNLKVLGFILANPFDYYTIKDIAELTGVARDTVKKYLDDFITKGYIDCNGGVRKKYKANLKNPIIQIIKNSNQKAVDVLYNIGDEVEEIHEFILKEIENKPNIQTIIALA